MNARNAGEKDMKKAFEKPIIKVITFEMQDVLAAGSIEADVDEKPIWSGCY